MKPQYWYVYYIHEDGEMMLYIRNEDEPDPKKPPVRERWSPYHRISQGNMPRLWRSAQAAHDWIRFGSITLMEDVPERFIGAWDGVEQVHTNPYGNPEATQKRQRVRRNN